MEPSQALDIITEEQMIRAFLDIRSIDGPNRQQHRGLHSFRLYCNDGFNLSIQGTYSAYCTPRMSYEPNFGYSAVEIGFPSDEETLLDEYWEDPEDPTSTVCPYVPFELVLQVIKKHGGFDAKTSYAQHTETNTDKDMPKGAPMSHEDYLNSWNK